MSSSLDQSMFDTQTSVKMQNYFKFLITGSITTVINLKEQTKFIHLNEQILKNQYVCCNCGSNLSRHRFEDFGN